MADARGSLLIAAVSGRALARAAANAGYVPLVADFFADTDTRQITHGCAKLPDAIEDGFHWPSLEAALLRLEKDAPSPVLGVIYGSGFEDRPYLLDSIRMRWPLLGNDAKTVARIKDPRRFFETLTELAIPHPATTTDRPQTATGWIAKRRGGAGGSHVKPVEVQDGRTGLYYQAFVPGPTVSTLFVANGQHVRVLGFSEQWTSPAPAKPWRYGGAMQPASIPQEAAEKMTETAAKLARAYALKGLASADFVLSGDEPYLLEVNPRPGATLDIFWSVEDPLLAIHLAAVLKAELPQRAPHFSDGQASAVLYAPESLTTPAGMSWPDWAADVPHERERIDKHRPICTVLARAGSGAQAKELVETRQLSLLAGIQTQAHVTQPNAVSARRTAKGMQGAK